MSDGRPLLLFLFHGPGADPRVLAAEGIETRPAASLAAVPGGDRPAVLLLDEALARAEADLPRALADLPEGVAVVAADAAADALARGSERVLL
ncbi:MAG TPA: hypothetical protein VFX98_00420, partial [Longimicrobiaceae bacterium]|nr:hypothetical protein [Longimicrobiaceae bacterium]